MRTIKFRAYLPDLKKMETGLFGLRSDGKASFNSDCILMQFTGSTDKNGVEIYEGDRVLVRGRKQIGMYETEIIYSGLGFMLKDNQTYLNDYKLVPSVIEVIGNIYQNENQTEQ